MANADINVLVVDDEGELRNSIVANLSLEDFNVFSADSARQALEVIKANRIDFVLSDIRMPGEDGVKLLEKIKSYDSSIPVVVLMTGFSEYSREEVIAKGAVEMIEKPFDFDLITQIILGSVKAA